MTTDEARRAMLSTYDRLRDATMRRTRRLPSDAEVEADAAFVQARLDWYACVLREEGAPESALRCFARRPAVRDYRRKR